MQVVQWHYVNVSNTYLLCNGVGGLLRGCAEGKGNDASIHNAHVRQSIYTKPGIEDT